MKCVALWSVVLAALAAAGNEVEPYRLDRDESDLTKVREGLQLIQRGDPWGGSESGKAWVAFDNDPNTACDLCFGGSDGRGVAFGIDFGSDPARITKARALSRNDGNCIRLANAVICGSNSENWWESYTVISETINTTGPSVWTEVNGTVETMYRYVFIFRPDNGDFWANVAELELYGLRLSDLGGTVVAPSGLAVTETETGARVTWEPAANAESYVLERRVGEGEWAVLAAELPATTTAWDDADVDKDGTAYWYRVTAVKGEERATSDPAKGQFFRPGDGTGLYATYYDVSGVERKILERVDATIGGNWGMDDLVPGYADYVRIVWTGRIVIPFEGDYSFSFGGDDVMSLMIDDEPLVASPAKLHLTAGEHAIRIDYTEYTQSAWCSLTWGGCVPEGPIPTGQLIPEAPAALPEDWLGGQLYSPAGGAGCVEYEPATDSYRLFHTGCDMWGGAEGYTYLWRKARSDRFTMTVKVVNPTAADNFKSGLMVRNSEQLGGSCLTINMRAEWNGQHFYWDVNGRFRGNAGIDNVAVGSEGSRVCYLRIERDRSLFTFSWRPEDSEEWKTCCTYEDAAGEFGKKLVVGPMTYSGGGIPMMAGRFSEFKLDEKLPGLIVIIQ